MESRRSLSLLALAVVALVVSSSFASEDAPAMAAAKKGVVVTGEAAPYCEVMVPCNVPKCTSLCVGKGMSSALGFCTFKPDFQFYCCCPQETPAAS